MSRARPRTGERRSRRPLLDRTAEEFAADFSAGAKLLGDVGPGVYLLAEARRPTKWTDVLDLRTRRRQRNRTFAGARVPLESGTLIAFLTPKDPATATYLLSKLDAPLASDGDRQRTAARATQCRAVRIGRAVSGVTPLVERILEDALREMR